MAVAVREGIDYRLLEDDYRANFKNTYKAKKDIKGREYYRCVYCGERVYLDQSEMQVDHIIPKTRLKAGILWNPNKAWNLGPSCGPCNASKSNYLDSRVLVGFRNKMLSNFGLIIADKGEGRTENQTTTAMLSIMIALVSFFAMVLLPIIGMVVLGVIAIVKSLLWIIKSVCKIIKKKGRRTFKKVFKKYVKKPVRNTAVVCVFIYTCFSVPELYTNLFNLVSNIYSNSVLGGVKCCI